MGDSLQFKVVLLGEGCVGKTSLVLRYCQNVFNDKHVTTMQVAILWIFLKIWFLNAIANRQLS